MLALSVRQPYAELILRGMKVVEYRSQSTKIVGERFWIYATKKEWPVGRTNNRKQRLGEPVLSTSMDRKSPTWSTELEAGDPPPWMLELANALRLFRGELPRGVIVGSAVIERVTRGEGSSGGYYRWHLADVQRLAEPRKPKRHPQPVWWRPW